MRALIFMASVMLMSCDVGDGITEKRSGVCSETNISYSDQKILEDAHRHFFEREYPRYISNFQVKPINIGDPKNDCCWVSRAGHERILDLWGEAVYELSDEVFAIQVGLRFDATPLANNTRTDFWVEESQLKSQQWSVAYQVVFDGCLRLLSDGSSLQMSRV